MVFKPGVSGNPAGRPKELSALQREFRKYAPEMLERLLKIARDDGEATTARLTAINSILDRGMGRPAQNIAIEARALAGKIAELTVDELRQLEERLIEASAPGLEANGIDEQKLLTSSLVELGTHELIKLNAHELDP